jgi:hypothetical protein
MMPIDSLRDTLETNTATQTLRSLLQLTVVGLLIGVLLFQGVNLPVSVKGLFVVLLLWLIGRTSATPLLIAFQMVLYFVEPNRSVTAGGLGSCVFVAIVVALLMFLSRDQTLKRLARRRVSDLVRSLLAMRNVTPESSSPDRGPPLTSPDLQFPTSFLRSIAALVICVLVARFLLIASPIPGWKERGPQSISAANELLAPVPSLLIVIIATVIVLSSLTGRRLTREQASMYLRSTQVNLLHSDIRMIVRSRLNFRRRRKRTSSKMPSKIAEPN